MANLGIEIKRKCPICGKVFIIKTLDSVYCSPKCSKVANKRKKDKEKKEALFVTYAQNVPDIREYLTARQVVAIYGIERSTCLASAGVRYRRCVFRQRAGNDCSERTFGTGFHCLLQQHHLQVPPKQFRFYHCQLDSCR